MLFNSFEFIFGFLPAAMVGFAVARRIGRDGMAIYFLVGASLFFYGWWDWHLIWLLVGSVIANYAIGRLLVQHPSKTMLGLGVALNLGLLGWFKYAGFFTGTLNELTGTSISLGAIVLPLAISFFTFQQIAYLMDVRQGLAYEPDFGRYCLFVTFFPQLIAGPIVHHSEILPQYDQNRARTFEYDDLAAGFSIFAIGLFKKVVLADPMGNYADVVFDAAKFGDPVSFISAWAGLIAFSLEIYFDFSGYSDMAIGLARLFGIRLPLNFNSPYRSVNIIEFWRRWHITLSRFLRDYLYIPLGGNRKGPFRRYENLMIVMLLGGLWHGAAWHFVIWGGLHGLFLVANHGWHKLKRIAGWRPEHRSSLGAVVGWLVTMTAVIVAWVFFRAETWDTATSLLTAMAGQNGIFLPLSYETRLGPIAGILGAMGVKFGTEPDPAIYPTLIQFFSIAGLGALVSVLPNTQQWMARCEPALNYASAGTGDFFRRIQWRPNAISGMAMAVLLVIALGFLLKTEGNEFIYFQF